MRPEQNALARRGGLCLPVCFGVWLLRRPHPLSWFSLRMAWQERALGSSNLGPADARASTFCSLATCGRYQTCQLDLSADSDVLRNPTGQSVNTRPSLKRAGQRSRCAGVSVLSLGAAVRSPLRWPLLQGPRAGCWVVSGTV